jgi:glycosyltransferase involved in cell wall biosynthesis
MARRREVYLRLRRGAGRLRARLAARRQAAPGTQPSHSTSAGHAPDVARESTNLGPVLDEAVLRAKRRMRIGADPDYDLVYENFDVIHYYLQAPHLLEKPQLDLVEHFLENGLAEGLSPDIDFSMGGYTGRYPRKATARRERSPYLEWLKRGRAAGEIADPAPGIRPMAEVLGMDPQQVIDLVRQRRHDVQQRFRTGKLGEMFARAAEIEPLIGAAWPEVARTKLLPLSTPVAVGELAAIYRAQEIAGFRRARLVLVINRARWGGGRRMEGHLTHALVGHVDPDDIVVIYTDNSAEGPDSRFPAGVRQIDFARLARPLQPEQAHQALVLLLRTFHADAIVNINSKMLHHAMRTYARPLAASERVFPCLFCNEQTAMGTLEGWSLRDFYRGFDHVEGVITDSDHFARYLIATYGVTESQQERLHVFRAPVDPGLPVAPESPARPGRRPQVFWAGRWDRQKRIDLFLGVAERMPDVDFRMWGAPLLGGSTPSVPPNVSVEGLYGHISDIPLAEADAWLYTSGWDGVPSQLLEVSMTGIPIVGTLVGGTGEVLGADDSWPVPEDQGAEAYVEAVRAVLADPAESRRRALALRERMLRQRTEKEFATQVANLLLRDDANEETGR